MQEATRAGVTRQTVWSVWAARSKRRTLRKVEIPDYEFRLPDRQSSPLNPPEGRSLPSAVTRHVTSYSGRSLEVCGMRQDPNHCRARP